VSPVPVTMSHVLALIPADATSWVRPGPMLSVTFTDRDQRTRFRTRFHHSELAVAGTTFTLSYARQWVDEAGYGLILATSPC
jgi:hypothetical protein